MIKVVFAHSFNENGKAFGNGNGLPWPHLKEDMEMFQESTYHSVVVMGMKTWESLPGRLPGRVNVVMGKYLPDNKAGEVPDMLMHGDLYQALTDLRLSYPSRDICVIGGLGLIDEAIEFADEVHITQIYPSTQAGFEADTYISNQTIERIHSDFTVVSKHEIQFSDGPVNSIVRKVMRSKC